MRHEIISTTHTPHTLIWKRNVGQLTCFSRLFRLLRFENGHVLYLMFAYDVILDQVWLNVGDSTRKCVRKPIHATTTKNKKTITWTPQEDALLEPEEIPAGQPLPILFIHQFNYTQLQLTSRVNQRRSSRSYSASTMSRENARSLNGPPIGEFDPDARCLSVKANLYNEKTH